MRTAIIGCVVLVGCAKKPADHDVAKPIDSQVVISPDNAATAKPAAPKPAAPPATPPTVTDCKGPLWTIMGDIARSFSAANTFDPRQEALRKWPLVPEACHTGLWYLEAAILVTREPELTAGNIKIASEEAALTLALQQPDDLDVLQRVAFVSTLGRKPALPDDACKRAKAIGANEDRAAYVCARAAIAVGDGKTAKAELAAIKSQSNFVDFALASAQAAKLNKDTKTMKAQAKLAAKLGYESARLHMIVERDRKALIALAKSLSK
jgi:hypothetical protein